MSYNIKQFQKRYGLSNKEVANVCQCSLPTIQKWRSGEVNVSGSAVQLMKLLDLQAEGSREAFREALGKLSQYIETSAADAKEELNQLESSVTKVVDRLEVMLESRRRESELAESEARYRSMAESSTYPISRWKMDTTLTYANEAYARFFSQFGDNLVGRQWLDFAPANRREALVAIVSNMVRCGEPEKLLEESLDSTGAPVHMEWLNFPIKNERGQIVEWHSSGRDVTELVRLRNEVAELKQIKASFESGCNLPTLLFDNTGRFIQMNPCFRMEILKDHEWAGFSDMIPGKASGKFKRLLKRLSEKEEICYQLNVEGRIWLLKGQLVSRNGKNSRFAAIFEELCKEDRNPVLEVRLENEVVLDGEPREFLMERKAARKVESQMAQLGRAVHVDRIYVFTFDEEESVFDNILEWCAEGITPQISELKRIPMEEYPWWIDRLRKRQWIQIVDTNKLPRHASREREILQAQGISSLLVAPVEVNESVIGFVGFDHNESPRIWHDQEIRELTTFKEAIEQVLAESMDRVQPAQNS